MQLNETMIGKIAVVKVEEKRLESSVALDFRERIVEFIKKGNLHIVLNLSEVEFIDSSGLAAMVSALKTLGGKGNLVICGVRESVLVLFQLTRLDRVFRLFSSEKEAIATLSS